MKRTLALLCIATPMLFVAAAYAEDVPKVTHYSLKLRVLPKERRLSVAALMTLTNNTGQPQKEIPLLLYRLLEVQSVTDENGQPLKFSQNVLGLSDERNLQANVVSIRLGTPLLPNKSLRVNVTYAGSIFGYPEVMAYVRDTISEAFSLIRPDAFSYPMLALPSFKSVSAAYDSSFTYDLETTVPADYTVACGGLLTATTRRDNTVTFVHRSKIPTWRIDIAIAKFKTLADEERKLFVYVLPEDEPGAMKLLNEMKNVIAFYSRMFGPVKNYQGYTAIEIRDGWGSQASDYYFLQTSAAFKDSERIGEMYHEVGHSWNARAKPGVKRCRYFDEAFASYFESLAIREFKGDAAFLADMEKSRDLFAQWAKYERRNYDTPIADYWKEERGRLSYTKGAWSLYVLHQLVGEENFRGIVRELLRDFSESGADFEDFRKTAERVSGKNLSKFFAEWIYGAESSRVLVDKLTIEEIVRRYP
ncbi:MAG TPA: M1 family aminopeptidase [Blastocatellia bacterium]|nr:M1 family aminopeptidase [Blastocatellia bacterium]